MYRLRRHGGDRVLSCIKSGCSNAVWLDTTTTKVIRSSQSEWSSMNCFAPAESSHGRLMGIVIEVHDQKRKNAYFNLYRSSWPALRVAGSSKISMDPACAHLCFRVSPGPHPKRRQASNWRAFTVRKSAGGEVQDLYQKAKDLPDLGTKRNSKISTSWPHLLPRRGAWGGASPSA